MAIAWTLISLVMSFGVGIDVASITFWCHSGANIYFGDYDASFSFMLSFLDVIPWIPVQ